MVPMSAVNPPLANPSGMQTMVLNPSSLYYSGNPYMPPQHRACCEKYGKKKKKKKKRGKKKKGHSDTDSRSGSGTDSDSGSKKSPKYKYKKEIKYVTKPEQSYSSKLSFLWRLSWCTAVICYKNLFYYRPTALSTSYKIA